MKKVVCAALAGALATPMAAQALPISLVFDEFTDEQTIVATGVAPVTSTSTLATGNVLGGFRDLQADKTAGSSAGQVLVEVNPLGEDKLRVSTSSATNGRAVVRWDGGANGSGLGFGLGGLDFLIYDTLELGVTFSDLVGPVRFNFYNSAGDAFASTTLNVPATPLNSDDVLTRDLLSGNFAVSGPGTFESIMSDVGAVQMFVDASAPAQTSWDANFSFARLTGESSTEVPLPASALLLLAGGGALGALRLRRKAA